jgi:hypothetical protein
MRSLAIVLALTGLLAACSPSGQSATPPSASGPGGVSASVAANDAQRYSNAFAYCRAIGTIDRPDSRYTGSNPPPVVIAGLIKAFHAPPSGSASQAFTRGTYWRCMNHAVYACNVGANLPCESKANTARAPSPGEKKYCATNHDADIIPMYVTGHNTIYDWHCNGEKPVAGKTVSQVDARGYLKNIWYRIPPPDTIQQRKPPAPQ